LKNPFVLCFAYYILWQSAIFFFYRNYLVLNYFFYSSSASLANRTSSLKK